MKTLALLALLIVALPLRADILANGSFADGTAHWAGDAHTGDSGGIVIQLDPVKWTVVSQTFDTHETALNFNVTFQTGAEFGFSDVGALLSKGGLKNMTGLRFKKGIKLKPGTWLIMVADPSGDDMQYFPVPVKAGVTDPQTVNGSLTNLVAHEEKTIYLAFPPGQGSITLLHVELTPGSGTGSPASSN